MNEVTLAMVLDVLDAQQTLISALVKKLNNVQWQMENLREEVDRLKEEREA
jgi:hypothetical protein